MRDLERYKRNTAIRELNDSDQQKIFDAKVLVCGCGGLGSSVISSLVSMGVGTLGIVDYDVLEKSNFNRQFIHLWQNLGKEKTKSAAEWIESYNHDIKVNEYNLKLDESNYKGVITSYDIVVDCFDSFDSKFMLNRICHKENKILIHGGVEEFRGQVMTINPYKSACLNCVFSQDNSQSNLKGIISPVVSAIGSIQAMEVFKVIVNKGQLLTDCVLSYDCIEARTKKIKISPNPDCAICAKQD